MVSHEEGAGVYLRPAFVAEGHPVNITIPVPTPFCREEESLSSAKTVIQEIDGRAAAEIGDQSIRTVRCRLTDLE